MKKFINIMLAVALTAGLATITVAQDAPKDTTKKTAKKAKAKTTTDTTKAPKAKGKGKKSKDAKDATPTK